MRQAPVCRVRRNVAFDPPRMAYLFAAAGVLVYWIGKVCHTPTTLTPTTAMSFSLSAIFVDAFPRTILSPRSVWCSATTLTRRVSRQHSRHGAQTVIRQPRQERYRLFSTSPVSPTTTTTTTTTPGYEQLFDLMLPEGRCVGVKIGTIHAISSDDDHHTVENPLLLSSITTTTITTTTTSLTDLAPWVHAALHPEEVQYVRRLTSESSQKSFIGGRLALRHAMDCCPWSNNTDCILLKDAYGRPNVPPSFRGSISHKGNVAVALVATTTTTTTTSHHNPMAGGWAIGVDLEVCQEGRGRIASRILTPDEQQSLGLLNPHVSADQEVLLRFSIKEALYKAMHPLICQYVSFQEAEVQPLDDGSVRVQLNLTSGANEMFESVSAHWQIVDGFFLTSAKIRLRPGIQPRTEKAQPEECRL